MERKIGEIFEYNGEWYQCIIGHCNQCSFDEAGTCKFIGNPYCAYRNDKKLACFKKLEKVGEPYRRWLSPFNNVMVQRYRLYGRNVIMPDEPIMLLEPNYKNSVEIEIKQIKEDMEEKKLNLKPFDIQKAREGKPVCTRDGRRARIICFDLKNNVCPIVAAVEENNMEVLYHYDTKGLNCYKKSEIDLMMLPDKKERWINVYKELCYESKEEAIRHIAPGTHYIGTIKVEWEE